MHIAHEEFRFIDDPAQRVLCGRILQRTQSMFGLLVATCDYSYRAASRRAEVDPRSLDELRSVPTLGVVARIAAAIGLEAGSAVAALASSAGEQIDGVALRLEAAEADLDDDAPALERVSSALHANAQHPTELALAHLITARAFVARGEFEAADTAVELAFEFGLAESDHALAGQLAEAMHYESFLGTPWQGGRASRAVESSCAARLLSLMKHAPRSERSSVASQRLRCWQLAERLLAEHGPGKGSIEALRVELDKVIEHGSGGRALAWAASIAAITALRLRARRMAEGGDDGETAMSPSTRVLSLIVAAELALEDGLRLGASAERSAVLARATRVALCEWSTRFALNEIDPNSMDEADLEELVRACLRFPAAKLSPMIAAITRAKEVNFV